MTTTRLRLLISTGLALAFLVVPATAHARAALISASPFPGQTLDRPPDEVLLTFSAALDPDAITLVVVDAVGVHVDKSDAHLVADSDRAIAVSLPPLEEGLYTVNYTVTDLAGEETTSDSYQFALDFPTPQIRLLSPPDGAGFEISPIEVEVDTGRFDLVEWEHSWRLYLDDIALVTTQEPTYTLPRLEPGVYELEVVLVDPEGAELNMTRSETYIAVGERDVLAQEIAEAAAAPPDPGLRLTPVQGALLAVAGVFFLGAGVLLGRRPPSDAA